MQGGRQFGRVGASTLASIPMMPDGSLDPAFNPISGALRLGHTQAAQSFIAEPAHIYATALDLAGVSPAGKGRNTKPPMAFVKRTP